MFVNIQIWTDKKNNRLLQESILEICEPMPIGSLGIERDTDDVSMREEQDDRQDLSNVFVPEISYYNDFLGIFLCKNI